MSIEQNLHAERITHLDLSAYVAVASGTPIRAVVTQMREARCNCAFVVRADALVGIFTDRDVMRRVVDARQTWDAPLDEVMTPAPFSVGPEAATGEALGLMDSKGFRNVPVVGADAQTVGNLNYYSILKFLGDHFQEQAYNLLPNPEQLARYRNRA